MAKPIVSTEHLHVFLTVKELDKELNKLALGGWTVISSYPTVANMASLKGEAVIFCLLSREVEI